LDGCALNLTSSQVPVGNLMSEDDPVTTPNRLLIKGLVKSTRMVMPTSTVYAIIITSSQF